MLKNNKKMRKDNVNLILLLQRVWGYRNRKRRRRPQLRNINRSTHSLSINHVRYRNKILTSAHRNRNNAVGCLAVAGNN
jgi:hypothetical protein